MKSVKSQSLGSREPTSPAWHARQLPFVGLLNRANPRASARVNLARPRSTESNFEVKGANASVISKAAIASPMRS